MILEETCATFTFLEVNGWWDDWDKNMQYIETQFQEENWISKMLWSGLLSETESVLTFYASWPSPWNAFADIAWHEFHEPSEQTPIVCGLPSPPSSAWSRFRFEWLGGSIQWVNGEYAKESSLLSIITEEGEVMNTEVTTTWWPGRVRNGDQGTKPLYTKSYSTSFQLGPFARHVASCAIPYTHVAA